MQFTELKAVFSRLVGCNITSMERIGGGRNSQVHRLRCEDSTLYAGKVYLRHSLDSRDRLGVEFSSLGFLWENGVRCVPRPIAVDMEHRCAVYAYIDGRSIQSQEVTNSDIDVAVALLVRLKEMTRRKASEELPLASEACFSVQCIVDNIRQRLSRLSAVQSDEAHFIELREYLTEDFIPSLDEIVRWCKACLKWSDMSFVSDLPTKERTLSPSDFGFHNALRRSDGRIVFLDFEHAGWDDPAKMVSDFLLHPAMSLSESLKQRFVTSILSGFGDYNQLLKRTEIVYPLFGLKWCLILLNEFVPEHMVRRRFASAGDLNSVSLCFAQLIKARQMLQKVRREYRHFPYYG